MFDMTFAPGGQPTAPNEDTVTTTAPAGIAVVTECHCCGYEADDAGPPPRRCPKCGASAWTRFARLTANPEPTHCPNRSGAQVPRRTSRRAVFDRPTHHVSHRRGTAVA